MKSCSRSNQLHVSFCCIYVVLRGSLTLSGSDSATVSARGWEVTRHVGWLGVGLESCVTTWGKRYKVLIKIVFSCACYYKGVYSQVGYRFCSGLRHELGLGMWLWKGEGQGWRGWAASGRAASHHSSCLCMHIKVKISNGDNDRTHSCVQLRRIGLVWATVNG